MWLVCTRSPPPLPFPLPTAYGCVLLVCLAKMMVDDGRLFRWGPCNTSCKHRCIILHSGLGGGADGRHWVCWPVDIWALCVCVCARVCESLDDSFTLAVSLCRCRESDSIGRRSDFSIKQQLCFQDSCAPPSCSPLIFPFLRSLDALLPLTEKK